MKAIPVSLQTMTRQFVLYSNTVLEMRSLCIKDTNLKRKHFTNTFIRKVLAKQYFSSQLKRKYVLQRNLVEEEAKKRKQYNIIYNFNNNIIKYFIIYKIMKGYLVYSILPKGQRSDI